MNKADYEKRTEELVVPIVDELSFELVDVEFVKEGGDYYLRVYIDKEGGITVDDCEVVSRKLDVLLDEKDFIAESYILEVSSPGLTRPLKKERDFERSIGKRVEIKLYKAVDGTKELEGNLSSFSADRVVIEDEDRTFDIERSNISLIRLAFVD